jgi:endonuclease/exonuclease/phosphatase family metal-dependent hydrolase
MILAPRLLTRRMRQSFRLLPVLLALGVMPVVAAAQTTVTLDAPGSELTDDVTIRGGGYAGVNFSSDDTLTTKTSSNSTNVRRVLMKFDTANTIPAGANITSARLTLTLKSAGAASSRSIAVQRVTKSFIKNSATWLDYRSGSDWSSAGGDLADRWATVSVGRTAGSTVSFDLTNFVQQTVNNAFGTRYTRFALVDVSSASDESMRVFYSSRASTSSVRPRLVVTYGGSTTSSPTPTTTTGTTLKVVTYNTHHGVGTDGRYNLDRIATVVANQNPDVVGLNEVMYNSSYGGGENQPETYKRLLEQKTGRRWYYVYARMDGNWSSTSWAVGNQLLSRFPFSTTTKYELSTGAHSVAQGTIVVNSRTINLFSTHVSWENSSWRTTETWGVRNWASTWAENRIVMGDFNTWPGTSDHRIMTSAYSDTWAAGVSAGIASSPSGSAGYTKGSSRFDYIYRSLGASALVLTRIVVPNTSSGGVKPSDHDPVVATFTVR